VLGGQAKAISRNDENQELALNKQHEEAGTVQGKELSQHDVAVQLLRYGQSADPHALEAVDAGAGAESPRHFFRNHVGIGNARHFHHGHVSRAIELVAKLPVSFPGLIYDYVSRSSPLPAFLAVWPLIPQSGEGQVAAASARIPANFCEIRRVLAIREENVAEHDETAPRERINLRRQHDQQRAHVMQSERPRQGGVPEDELPIY
jgi:hypothetical protein